MLILWTLQPVSFYGALERDGVIHADSALILEDFLPAYDWLCGRMREKIGPPPPGVRHPVWAWHTWDWKRQRPDMRLYQFRDVAAHVRIEFEIPDDQVVLSDNENWHFVLNDWFLGESTSDSEWEAEEAWFDSLSSDRKEIEKRKSWERVFDLGPVDHPWRRKGMDIQATFWELRMEQVRKTSFHPAKKRAPIR